MAVPITQWPFAAGPGRVDGTGSPLPPFSPLGLSPVRSQSFSLPIAGGASPSSPCQSPRGVFRSTSGGNTFQFRGMSPPRTHCVSPRSQRPSAPPVVSAFSFNATRSTSFGSSAPVVTRPSFQMQFRPEDVMMPGSPRDMSPGRGIAGPVVGPAFQVQFKPEEIRATSPRSPRGSFGSPA